ncbi:MAG: hypothetical protein QNJ70_01930 [Xenococcaceae cyanobacterium MO_207.B15]|nr:hypothetical protein [Xenococcaceae cyanobacterium MO_207.B15]
MAQSYQEIVEKLQKTTWNVAITIVILSTLTAILTEAAYNFGIRSWVQRQRVKEWIKRRNRTNYHKTMKSLQHWTGTDNGSSLYSLSYQQLCGQIANALRNQLDYGEGDLLDIFAKNAHPEDLARLKNKNTQDLSEDEQKDLAMAQEQVFYYADRGLDDLQATLAKFWIRFDSIISIGISFLVLELLLTQPTTPYVGDDHIEQIFAFSVAIVSGFLAPIIRNFLVNTIYKK